MSTPAWSWYTPVTGCTRMPKPDTTGAPGIGHRNAGAPVGGAIVGVLAGRVVVVAGFAVGGGFDVGVPGWAVVVVFLAVVVVVFGFAVVVVLVALARNSAAICADSCWRSSIWVW